MDVTTAAGNESHNYGMLNAFLASCRSTDGKTKLGACILNKEMKIVGEGCNHFPPGFENMIWQEDPNHKDYKYNYVIFAIHDAIFNASETKGCTLYTNMYPSVEDSRLIVLSGIDTVVYFPRDATRQQVMDSRKVAESILKAAKVEIKEMKLSTQQVAVTNSLRNYLTKKTISKTN